MRPRNLVEELGRRIFHILSSIIAIVYILDIYTWIEIQVIVALGFLSVAVLEYDRLILKNRFFPFYRDYEKNTLAGYAWAVFGIFVAVFLFKPTISVVSILILSFADPVQGVLYNIFGPSSFRKVKPLYMLFVMFVVSFSVGGIFSILREVDLSLLQILGGSIGATIADGVKINFRGHIIDDNFTIPVYSGIFMSVLGFI